MANAIMMKGDGGTETITIAETKTTVTACMTYFNSLGLSGDFMLVKKSGTVRDYEVITSWFLNGQCQNLARTGPVGAAKSLTTVSSGTSASIITAGDVFEVAPAYYGW